jgi:hypothetical protein
VIRTSSSRHRARLASWLEQRDSLPKTSTTFARIFCWICSVDPRGSIPVAENGMVSSGVVRNHATVLAKRHHRRISRELLAEDIIAKGPEDGEESGNVLEGWHNPARYLELKLDAARVIAELPPHLEALARMLSRLPVTGVCRSIGKSRSRFYQMRRDLQHIFRQAGLDPLSSNANERGRSPRGLQNHQS